MAFICATGKHRKPGRVKRTTAQAAGIAALTTTGVIGTLAASPALAAEHTVEQTGLTPVLSASDDLAAHIDAQAVAQQRIAEHEAAEKAAAVRAKEARAAKARAAREAERKRLNAFVAPIAHSYVSTGYQASSSLWSSGSHTGIDFHAMTGTSVHAVGAGTVVSTGWGGAYGNQIVLRMADGMYTQYGHLSSIGVTVGQQVTAGEQIGLSGATGNVTGPHLHFEARTSPDYGSDVDPLAYLRGHGVNV
ncbi:peptidoglycan DD-metalloendopeptidase family protein [Streptomyces sp. SID8366]|uniref:M23 family metallopeptidase n=1 Tax=unclassified Streptomyces TaxID=2593676 RepID=UPI000DBA1F8F|nr:MULTISPECIES: M23 family metallopeptidase [unclassified Streptomyces]MYU04965.1 peptidoglycan DD-metalloendopeptidase family protein [Streptomyces sp. SID8366]MYU62563.1 peptidoglycan DD-metalloendopeptidase family protein [Streptomyces sp. SID69]RAJ65832.1 peptidase M23-like protein [Streptomyces sp. PsTaAH-130]